MSYLLRNGTRRSIVTYVFVRLNPPPVVMLKEKFQFELELIVALHKVIRLIRGCISHEKESLSLCSKPSPVISFCDKFLYMNI